MSFSAKLLCFTDLHVKGEGETILGIDPLARFEDALSHALAHHPDAERVILMGDLVNSGKPEEYARLAPVLARCPLPVTLMPGNHDDRAAMAEVLGAERDRNGFLQSWFETETHRVICLDTVFGERFLSFAALGQLCEKRLAWLARALETEKPVLLVAHHPPMRVGFPGMDEIRLRDDEALARVIAGTTVQHILCGHLHRTVSGHWRGIGFTVFKSTCHQMPLALESKGLSLSTDEPGAYGIVLLGEEGIVVHSEDWQLARRVDEDCAEAVAEG